MSDTTFDPFTLPSSFDPLATTAPPPPRRRRREVGPAPPEAAVAAGRLAHLLAPRADRAEARPGPEAPTARLAALEDELAILTARVDALQVVIDQQLDRNQDRLLRAVGALLDEHRARR